MFKLYPQASEVLENSSLECYFRPLLTFKYSSDKKEYNIHLFSTDGLFCTKKNKYSEQNFFGFQYNNGLYKFLGNIDTFAEYKRIPELYKFLKSDFENKKEDYLSHKVKVADYVEILENNLTNFNFENLENASYYTGAFYSYELTKYNYTKTGIHTHISVLTENYTKNNDDFLLSQKSALNVLEEFFINIGYNLTNNYNINKEMFCCATDRSRFTSIVGGGVIFGLLDGKNEIVYILEYNS